MKFRGCAKIRGAKIKGARKFKGIRYVLYRNVMRWFVSTGRRLSLPGPPEFTLCKSVPWFCTDLAGVDLGEGWTLVSGSTLVQSSSFFSIQLHTFFSRQLGCLAFSLRFWPKIKQFLSNCPASLDFFFQNRCIIV